MKTVRVEIYMTRARKTPWTWRLKHRNGNVIANAAETYDDRTKARRAGVNMAKLLGCEARELNPEDPSISRTVQEADPSPMTPAQTRNAARKVAVMPERREVVINPPQYGATVSQRVADDTRDDGSKR